MNPKIVHAKKTQKKIFLLQKKLDLLLLSISKKDFVPAPSNSHEMSTVTITGLQRKYEVSFSTAKTLFNKLIILGIIQLKASGSGFEVGNDSVRY